MKPFAREIAQIQATYAEFTRRGDVRTRWAPFAESESDVRAQQLLGFSQLMRAAGHLHLEGLRILDLGCGSGRHLRQCIDMGASPGDLHGVDLDVAAVTLGRQISPNIDIRLAQGDAIDFADGTFDLVTHYFAFSSMPGESLRRRLASEVGRVLKPGGLFFWWDMLHMAEAAGGRAEPLDAGLLFPGCILAALKLSNKGLPSETLRPSHLRRILGPLVDRLAPAAIFQAALIRPPAHVP